MGQTLTHGVYLPDEGERNCYNGLAANWQLLDGAVGTIAEHTSALSGKAPLVHTHGNITNDGKVGTTANKPLITGTGGVVQAGSFGNAANTFCEGNDSRLSDARTPVAHTHVTADVTDLLNSTHRWTANQILKNTAITDHKTAPSADTGIAWNFSDNNGKYWGGIGHNYLTTGISEVRISMTNWSASGSQGYWHLDFGATKDFSNVCFRPSGNNNIHLGSSSNQWKSVYAQSYYYNGTAWGLDKANVWSQSQTISTNTNKAYIIINTSYILGEETPSSTKELGGVFFRDLNGNNAAYLNVGHEKTTGDIYTRILTRFKFDNGVKSTTGSNVNAALDIGLTNSAEKFVRPSVNNEVNLGTPTNKWKSLNGINPGALSLPDYSKAVNLDVSAQGLNWNLTGATSNSYTPTFDGYLSLRCKDTNGDFLFATYGGSNAIIRNCAAGTGVLPGNAGLCLLIPMHASTSITIVVKATTNFRAYVIPCFGNV